MVLELTSRPLRYSVYLHVALTNSTQSIFFKQEKQEVKLHTAEKETHIIRNFSRRCAACTKQVSPSAASRGTDANICYVVLCYIYVT